MTLRERIADWLTGGRRDTLGQEAAEHEAAMYRAHAAMWAQEATQNGDACHRYRAALLAIIAATDGIKHGTAQKVNRMAREAVE